MDQLVHVLAGFHIHVEAHTAHTAGLGIRRFLRVENRDDQIAFQLRPRCQVFCGGW